MTPTCGDKTLPEHGYVEMRMDVSRSYILL